MDEKLINKTLAIFCGWTPAYVRRVGHYLVEAPEHTGTEGWIKKEKNRRLARVDCPNYLDGERMTELLVVLGREKFKVKILTHPHVVMVEGGTSSYSWDPYAIYAADNPGRALALAAYAAIKS